MVTGHVYIAISLDGFVARKDHQLDWLLKQDTKGEDYGFNPFMDSVDGLIMGRGSFQSLLKFDEWPYKKPVMVMSQTLCQRDIPQQLTDKVRLTKSSPEDVIHALNKEGWSRAYIDGGKIVQSFMKAGLIHDLTITTVPILIGTGIPLFGPIEQDIDLQLLDTKSFKSGMVQSQYLVK